MQFFQHYTKLSLSVDENNGPLKGL